MSQYKKLYGYRAPSPEVDIAWHNPPGPETSYFIFMRKGRVSIALLKKQLCQMFIIYWLAFTIIMQMYLVDVLAETSTGELDMIPPSHLIKMLNHILDDASEPAEHPVGILTADTRDIWYQVRQKLMQGQEILV